MKYIYIVTWTILINVPCQQPEPTYDEFGRPNLMVTHSLQCVQEKQMKREFFNRDSAVAFFDRGNWAMPNQMKIDSVLIENK